jgi:hypothetical protein
VISICIPTDLEALLGTLHEVSAHEVSKAFWQVLF